MSDEDYEQGFSEGYDQGLSTDKEKSFLILAARIDELKKEITRLCAELAAVTEERDAAKRSAYEDAARFIEENVFNYSSGDQNYWSHRKGDNTHGLEYAREFRARAAIEGVKEKKNG